MRDGALFAPYRSARLELANRFVHSLTTESMGADVKVEDPLVETVDSRPSRKKSFIRVAPRRLRGRLDLVRGCNPETADMLTPPPGAVPLISAVWTRRVPHMKEVLESGRAEVISLSRPFIGEQHMVGQPGAARKPASCVSRNRRPAAITGDWPGCREGVGRALPER